MHPSPLRRLFAFLVFILLVSLACSLPFAGSTPTPLPATATVPPAPTPTQVPLPPALIEADPPANSQLPPKGPLTLVFNQAMDRGSVENALKGQPTLSGRIVWQDDATLTFTPDQPFPAGTQLSISLEQTARAKNGLALNAPISLSYTTAGPLRLLESLPKDGADLVDPSSAVVASFDQAVVALGADPSGQPQAFTLDPPAQGRGEWINTSTYIFYPNPPLSGGKTYAVRLDPGLTSVAGTPLDSSASGSWSFNTALPRVVSVQPETEKPLPLDAPLVVSFNQPMQPASVEAGFSFQAGGAATPGTFDWNADYTSLTFKPAQLLARNTSYTLSLAQGVQSQGGTPLAEAYLAQLISTPDLAIASSQPAEGSVIENFTGYENLTLNFTAPLQTTDFQGLVSLEPSVSQLDTYLNEDKTTLYVYGYFQPNTAYTLTLSQTVTDAWGQSLSAPYTLHFRTPRASPNLTITSASTNSGVVFFTPQDSSLPAQLTNLQSVNVARGALPLNDFIALLGSNGYNLRQNYTPSGLQTWKQSFDLPADRSQTVSLDLSPDGKPLSSGLYYFTFRSPQLPQDAYGQQSPVLSVVSSLNLTFKHSATDALVWAVHLSDDLPAADVDVKIYAESGQILAQGRTDAQGLFHADLPAQQDPYASFFAVAGQPGSADFGVSGSTWSAGINGWDFGLSTDSGTPATQAYIYTDCPIYRPGQTVYFRAVIRQAGNGRYKLPDLSQVTADLYSEVNADGKSSLLDSLALTLSPYGSVHGQFTLPVDASPGAYRLSLPQIDFADQFIQVAEYQKPEIDLQVSLSPQEVLQGAALQAKVQASYFFGAPAGNLPVQWTLSQASDAFTLPDAVVGVLDTGWMTPGLASFNPSGLGVVIGQGSTKTAADGSLSLDLAAPKDLASTQSLTLEVTINDQSGQPVSARASVRVHPASFYIGLRPDSWNDQAGQALGFGVQGVDWNGQPSGGGSLKAEFQKVTWVQDQSASPLGLPTYTQQTTLVASTDFQTDAEGKARLSFTPPDPGTYLLDVSGGGARSQVLLWVGGSGEAVWPNLPDQHIHLTADAASYTPGQSARIFIPNPLGKPAPALVSVERGRILRTQVLTLEPNGSDLTLPLGADDAPNVYVSVTLLGARADGKPDFRQGYLNLDVKPLEQTLTVKLLGQPQRAAPGDKVTFTLQVTDSAEQPVQGEFSLAVVDRALLALADPNAPDILTEYYGTQPLGVQTALDLVAYSSRSTPQLPGVGGGGGGPGPQESVRQNFPDTAYWNASIVTGADGTAQVSFDLPDNLTTWQADLRGLTADTRVGQAAVQVVASKDLLIRPETPLFLVAGDHVELAAIAQNNTQTDLDTQVSLTAVGFALDDPGQAVQPVSVPAGGQVRITWWGTAQSGANADLVFSVRASANGVALQDFARPDQGTLPILKYTSPQTYSTSGVLGQAGQQIEGISLPHSFQPTDGELRVEMVPSLAAVLTSGLSALENSPYQGTEQTLSRFLPNLETYQALTGLGINSPALKDRLDRTLASGVQQLLSQQNTDGGWGWYPGSQSDAYISAYVLLGLSRAQTAGLQVDSQAISAAADYLRAGLGTPGASSQTWELDRMAFSLFALEEAGAGDPGAAAQVYTLRDQLNPWAKALLALTLGSPSAQSSESQTLISDLESSALRTATGAHWEGNASDGANPETPVFTTAVTLYALAQEDPASPLIPMAVQYVMDHRNADAAWSSTYESAWVLMALTASLKGTGDLQASYTFSATLNGSPLAGGQAGGADTLTAVNAVTPIQALRSDAPNALLISRGAGDGRLYYRADLTVDRPAETAPALDAGFSLSRAYYAAGEDCRASACTPITQASLGSPAQPNLVTVRLTLNVPHDAYYVQVEDYIPAGAQILDTSLKTSQQANPEAALQYDPRNPFGAGWGWWLFNQAHIFDDHIAWTAQYLPAGTYELAYTLIPQQAGEFRLLPARAWETYFPEVQGASAGSLFAIKR